jgi:hypothetical protein
MAVFNKFNCFVQDVANKKHDMKTGTADVFKVYLTNTLPVVTNTVYNTPADLATANGYTATGVSIGTITGAQSAGVMSFAGGTNPSWTASGGSITFEWAVLYNSTSGVLIGWWDYGTTITLTNGNTFTLTVPKLYNIARMNTAATGTGSPITLSTAATGFLSFVAAGVADGDTVTYAIEDGANREIGRGVYTAIGTLLSRIVLKSTNGNAPISLSGTAQVFITLAAEDMALTTAPGSAGQIPIGQGATSPPTWNTMSGDGTMSSTGVFTASATIARLTNANLWTKTQTADSQALTSATGADYSAKQIQTINVNGSTFTIANPSVAPADKSTMLMVVTFTTNNTLAFGAKYKVTGYTQSTTGKDALLFYYDSAADLYYLIGVRNLVSA